MSARLDWIGWNQQDETVLSCPFCGSSAIGYQVIQAANEKGYAVLSGPVYRQLCNDCGASGPAADTRTQSIVLWNQRKGAQQ